MPDTHAVAAPAAQTIPNSGPPLSLRLRCEAPAVFENLLQAGFFLPLARSTNLLGFLLDDLAIPGGYVQDRLQTVFVNGRPVDDFAAARVAPGARLALCAAMPGLVGATMRRSGVLAGFRQTISLCGQDSQGDAASQDAAGLVFVKLFNLVARELAGHFLGRGVLVPADKLAEHLAALPPGAVTDAPRESEALGASGDALVLLRAGSEGGA